MRRGQWAGGGDRRGPGLLHDDRRSAGSRRLRDQSGRQRRAPHRRCRLADTEPAPVTVSAGDTAEASLTVTCEEIGRLAFADRDPPDSAPLDIYVIDLNGTGRTRLTHGLDASSPSWSPDGLKIAYAT